MILHKITPFVDYNQWVKRLNTQLNEPTNNNLKEVPKAFKPTNKKTYYKTFGTSVINSPMSPPSLRSNSIPTCRQTKKGLNLERYLR